MFSIASAVSRAAPIADAGQGLIGGGARERGITSRIILSSAAQAVRPIQSVSSEEVSQPRSG